MTLDLKPQLGLLHMIEQKENGCLNQKNIFDNVIAAYLLNPLKMNIRMKTSQRITAAL